MSKSTTSGNTGEIPESILPPSDLIDDVFDEIPIDDEEIKQCVEVIIADLENDNLHSGADRRGLIGGAIYYALSKFDRTGHSGEFTQRNIGDWMGVSSQTIRGNKRRIQNHRSAEEN